MHTTKKQTNCNQNIIKRWFQIHWVYLLLHEVDWFCIICKLRLYSGRCAQQQQKNFNNMQYISIFAVNKWDEIVCEIVTKKKIFVATLGHPMAKIIK